MPSQSRRLRGALVRLKAGRVKHLMAECDVRAAYGFGPVHFIIEGICRKNRAEDPAYAAKFGQILDMIDAHSVDSGSEPLAMTPLAVAASRLQPFACRLLIEKGASVERACAILSRMHANRELEGELYTRAVVILTGLSEK